MTSRYFAAYKIVAMFTSARIETIKIKIECRLFICEKFGCKIGNRLIRYICCTQLELYIFRLLIGLLPSLRTDIICQQICWNCNNYLL